MMKEEIKISQFDKFKELIESGKYEWVPDVKQIHTPRETIYKLNLFSARIWFDSEMQRTGIEFRESSNGITEGPLAEYQILDSHLCGYYFYDPIEEWHNEKYELQRDSDGSSQNNISSYPSELLIGRIVDVVARLGRY